MGRPAPGRRPPDRSPLRRARRAARARWPPCCGGTGAPPEDVTGLQQASMPVRPFVWAVTPGHLDGGRRQARGAGWDLTAIWTPGHSPGHLCFYEAGNRLMLSGDHVLPRITPNISFHPQAGPDPLGDFLASLDKVGAYDVDEVLPAHEYRFVDLPGPGQRAESSSSGSLRGGHLGHPEGVDTAWGLAGAHDLEPALGTRCQGFMRRAAVGETLAHLRYLEQSRGGPRGGRRAVALGPGRHRHPGLTRVRQALSPGASRRGRRPAGPPTTTAPGASARAGPGACGRRWARSARR